MRFQMTWQTAAEIVLGLLWAAASLWDLAEEKIPLLLLAAMTVTEAVLLRGLSKGEILFRLVNACAVSGTCAVGLKKHMTGAGDVWCLALTALEVPVSRLPGALMTAFAVMGLVSCASVWVERQAGLTLITAGNGKRTLGVPLAPFLLLGMMVSRT